MKSLLTKCIALCAAFLLLLQAPLPAIACATCGCSELCALNLFKDSEDRSKTPSLLSESIWGRLILGIAYNRDPELQKLKTAGKISSVSTNAMLASAGAGTLPQGIVSVYTLPDSPDSYAPLRIGLVLESVTNLAVWSRMIVNAGLRRKIRDRQLVVRTNVENILHHLEFSQASCPEAQQQLTVLIGPKAAAECIALWTTSHGLADTGNGATPPKAEATPQNGRLHDTLLSGEKVESPPIAKANL